MLPIQFQTILHLNHEESKSLALSEPKIVSDISQRLSRFASSMKYKSYLAPHFEYRYQPHFAPSWWVRLTVSHPLSFLPLSTVSFRLVKGSFHSTPSHMLLSLFYNLYVLSRFRFSALPFHILISSTFPATYLKEMFVSNSPTFLVSYFFSSLLVIPSLHSPCSSIISYIFLVTMGGGWDCITNRDIEHSVSTATYVTGMQGMTIITFEAFIYSQIQGSTVAITLSICVKTSAHPSSKSSS